MSKEQIRIEALADILQELNIDLPTDQIKQIAKDFAYHMEMEQEMSSGYVAPYKPSCDKCKSLEYKIADLEKENEVFRNSVKQRRGASQVWIEGDSVRYEK